MSTLVKIGRIAAYLGLYERSMEHRFLFQEEYSFSKQGEGHVI